MNNKPKLIPVLAAVVIVLSIAVFAIFYLMKPTNNRMELQPVHREKISAEPSKPAFRKDGELQFVGAKSLKMISTIDYELAADNATRQQGLMYRDSMETNQGMLFLMEREEIQSFWMKNTILPLDIMFVNADRMIVSIHENCTPYSLSQIVSEKPALYVVEVNAGYVKANNIRKGDYIVF